LSRDRRELSVADRCKSVAVDLLWPIRSTAAASHHEDCQHDQKTAHTASEHTPPLVHTIRQPHALADLRREIFDYRANVIETVFGS
jgi:hypothetical protein